MRKILTIAVREYRAMVGTKAFMISIAMMPLLMFGGIAAIELLQNVGEVKDHKIVIVDRSGELFQHLKSVAEERNKLVAPPSSDGDENAQNLEGDEVAFSKGARYHLQPWESGEFADRQRLEVSDRIRNRELYAFVEIPEDILNSSEPVRFYSEDATLSEAKDWLTRVINQFVKNKRLQEAGIVPETVAKASIPVPVRGLGLVQESADGKIQEGQEKDTMSAIFIPLGVMMLMFMVIFMASQPMLESVLEEKAQRIAEVLLGSANPFQIMTGKLLGTVGGSLTVFAIYLSGMFLLAVYRGWTDSIPFGLVPWFIVFQVFGVLFFAAIFMAVGASVTQLKEAQSMLLPVWMLLMSPMFIWIFAVREPNGALATYVSFFPPATPTMMVLRMATGQTIPAWQPVVGLVILLLSTAVAVYIAARIFRVGLLWQGKTPKFKEMLTWAFRG